MVEQVRKLLLSSSGGKKSGKASSDSNITTTSTNTNNNHRSCKQSHRTPFHNIHGVQHLRSTSLANSAATLGCLVMIATTNGVLWVGMERHYHCVELDRSHRLMITAVSVVRITSMLTEQLTLSTARLVAPLQGMTVAAAITWLVRVAAAVNVVDSC